MIIRKKLLSSWTPMTTSSLRSQSFAVFFSLNFFLYFTPIFKLVQHKNHNTQRLMYVDSSFFLQLSKWYQYIIAYSSGGTQNRIYSEWKKCFSSVQMPVEHIRLGVGKKSKITRWTVNRGHYLLLKMKYTLLQGTNTKFHASAPRRFVGAFAILLYSKSFSGLSMVQKPIQVYKPNTSLSYNSITPPNGKA